MKSSEVFSLPLAGNEYDATNEQIMRRSVEQYVSELRDDVRVNESKKGKDGSLAIRRFQFLLMGAL